jgi:hypothetical protein
MTTLRYCQDRWETPPDDEPEGWQECEDCKGDDINCIRCDGLGGYAGDWCCTQEEHAAFIRSMTEEA